MLFDIIRGVKYLHLYILNVFTIQEYIWHCKIYVKNTDCNTDSKKSRTHV